MMDRLYILGMIALVCAGMTGLLWMSKALAQTASVPAYEGAAFAWDYPSNTPNHTGFRLTVDGITGNTQIGKDVRQIPLADTVLKGKPFGAYTVKLIAVAISPAVNSAPAVLAIDYLARPTLPMPTKIRTILEWQP
jgi:hypothetical protein